MPASARILVMGSGVTGGEVLRQLIARDLPARALVRNPERAEALRWQGVEVIEGDFSQPESWQRALDDVASVFAITPAHRDAAAWNALLVDAAKESGVGKIVMLSGMSVSRSSPAKFHQLMARCDEAVMASGIGFTILQPNVFFQNMLGMAAPIRQHGKFRSAIGQVRISMIDVRDIAEVAIRALTDDTHLGRVYVLTGREALTYFDVARLLSEATGKTITYEALQPEQAVQALIALGVPEPVARERVEIHLGFSSGAFTPVTDDAERLLGRPPRLFSDFARDHAAVFR